jgi:hypothetical protein
MATTCIFDSGENLAYLIFEYAVVSKDVKEISHCPHPAACPHTIATAASGWKGVGRRNGRMVAGAYLILELLSIYTAGWDYFYFKTL